MAATVNSRSNNESAPTIVNSDNNRAAECIAEGGDVLLLHACIACEVRTVTWPASECSKCCGATVYHAHDLVALLGIALDPKLNGSMGTIITELNEPGDGRYSVRLLRPETSHGLTLTVQPVNLRPVRGAIARQELNSSAPGSGGHGR